MLLLCNKKTKRYKYVCIIVLSLINIFVIAFSIPCMNPLILLYFLFFIFSFFLLLPPSVVASLLIFYIISKISSNHTQTILKLVTNKLFIFIFLHKSFLLFFYCVPSFMCHLYIIYFFFSFSFSWVFRWSFLLLFHRQTYFAQQQNKFFCHANCNPLQSICSCRNYLSGNKYTWKCFLVFISDKFSDPIIRPNIFYVFCSFESFPINDGKLKKKNKKKGTEKKCRKYIVKGKWGKKVNGFSIKSLDQINQCYFIIKFSLEWHLYKGMSKSYDKLEKLFPTNINLFCVKCQYKFKAIKNNFFNIDSLYALQHIELFAETTENFLSKNQTKKSKREETLLKTSWEVHGVSERMRFRVFVDVINSLELSIICDGLNSNYL